MFSILNVSRILYVTKQHGNLVPMVPFNIKEALLSYGMDFTRVCVFRNVVLSEAVLAFIEFYKKIMSSQLIAIV